MDALVHAVQAEITPLAEIDATVRANILRNAGGPTKELAKQVLGGSASDRSAVLEAFTPALKLTSAPAEGAKLFTRLCLQCHAMQGIGAQVGPELSSVSLRAPASLLNDIIDPSGQVLPDFINYNLRRKDGDSVNGFIVAETPSSITLRRPNAPDETVTRDQIADLRAEGKSIMPDGLEEGLTHQDMANLISFIQRPTRELLIKAQLP